jgi:hypothetical protein
MRDWTFAELLLLACHGSVASDRSRHQMMVAAIRGTQINQYLSTPKLWNDEARISRWPTTPSTAAISPGLEALACASAQQTEVVS